jgi:hypothetical protein
MTAIPKTTSQFKVWLIESLREYDDPSDVIVSVLTHPDGVVVGVRGGDRFLLKVTKVES